MDLPAGSLRGGTAAAPSGAPLGGNEGRNGTPTGEEVKVPNLALPEGEEVGEEPRLPDEPCFKKPAPLGVKVKSVLAQLSSLVTAAAAALKSLGSRQSANLRGGPSPSTPDVEETRPVVHARLEAPAPQPAGGVIPESRPLAGEAGASVVGIVREEAPVTEEVLVGEEPRLPKEPCTSDSKSKGATTGLRKLLLKAIATAAAAATLLKEIGMRGVARVGRPQVALPAVEAGAAGSGSLDSAPASPSLLDDTQPGILLPRPDDVASGAGMA
ncbi:hypothetical protein, conserved [Eimeria brunetti]|uniref:Uncharacterized protein n=1 Tax=Eimeria brunetti TaxID=51314 RepID=U6LXI7_9EIME|nr:hypothetical protein, conserved [Eimeria brunetti]